MDFLVADTVPWYTDQDRNFMIYQGDSLELMARIPDDSIDLVFADPPYFLSNGGITCHSGKMVKVDKGEWDRSKGTMENHEFNLAWLREVKRILKPHGTVFVSGTHHVIFSIGFAMQQLGMRILNEIAWYKVNPPPNLARRYFTHATETIIWASKDEKSRHFFDYDAMREENGGKQMQSFWAITPPRKVEKRFGKHPTQKPLALLKRIVKAGSKPGDVVLDPFMGSGTTGIAAALLDRRFIGLEMETDYIDLAVKRYEDRFAEEEIVRTITYTPKLAIAAKRLDAPAQKGTTTPAKSTRTRKKK